MWIAFAVGSSGRIHVDAGARRALTERGSSLLAAGVTSVDGRFEPDDAVEVVDHEGQVMAKGLVRVGAGDLQADRSGLVIHRDDLVMLPD